MTENWATNRERTILVKQIRERDGELRCHWCGENYRRSIDHVVSRSNGGTNDLWNLVASCADCNARRGNTDDPLHCEFCMRAHKRLHTPAYTALTHIPKENPDA